MTSNPIQRKTRNSFLAGMLIMLVIATLIFAALYFLVLQNFRFNSITGNGTTVYAYKVISDIKSGESLNEGNVEIIKTYLQDIPTDFVEGSLNINDYKSKINLTSGTILGKSMLYQEESRRNSLKRIEYNMLTLPYDLKIGDYVDIRLLMPNGQDFIVVAKAEVKDIKETTVSFDLAEDEILMMSGAIIESYALKAANLYVNKYVEAGLQTAQTPTYAVNQKIYEIIKSNYDKGVNIEDYSKINNSYNTSVREIIDKELEEYDILTKQTNLLEAVENQKKTALDLYMSVLEGY